MLFFNRKKSQKVSEITAYFAIMLFAIEKLFVPQYLLDKKAA